MPKKLAVFRQAVRLENLVVDNYVILTRPVANRYLILTVPVWLPRQQPEALPRLPHNFVSSELLPLAVAGLLSLDHPTFNLGSIVLYCFRPPCQSFPPTTIILSADTSSIKSFTAHSRTQIDQSSHRQPKQSKRLYGFADGFSSVSHLSFQRSD